MLFLFLCLTYFTQYNNQQGPTASHVELCSMLHGGLDGRGVQGECIHVQVWLSLFPLCLKLSQHC